jgi:hypothetical protein
MLQDVLSPQPALLRSFQFIEQILDGLWSDRHATQCSYEHFVVKTLIELFSVMMTIRMCGPEYPESRSDRYARPCRGHRLDCTGPNMAKVGSPSGVRMDWPMRPFLRRASESSEALSFRI